LTVVTLDYRSEDSVTTTIEPYSNKVIKVLVGLGDQKKFDCCPCEFSKLYIRTANGNIKKDPNSKGNWVIPNKEKQKRYGGEDLKCEFYVAQTDI
jgi:hypothetical protein